MAAIGTVVILDLSIEGIEFGLAVLLVQVINEATNTEKGPLKTDSGSKVRIQGNTGTSVNNSLYLSVWSDLGNGWAEVPPHPLRPQRLTDLGPDALPTPHCTTGCLSHMTKDCQLPNDHRARPPPTNSPHHLAATDYRTARATYVTPLQRSPHPPFSS